MTGCFMNILVYTNARANQNKIVKESGTFSKKSGVKTDNINMAVRNGCFIIFVA